jgi:hypothetical protein
LGRILSRIAPQIKDLADRGGLASPIYLLFNLSDEGAKFGRQFRWGLKFGDQVPRNRDLHRAIQAGNPRIWRFLNHLQRFVCRVTTTQTNLRTSQLFQQLIWQG